MPPLASSLVITAHLLQRTRSGFRTQSTAQGTLLDRIDFNIEQAADRVGAAVVELNKANEYQKKSKTMLCIYCLLLLCGLMVIILLLKNSV